VAHQAAARGRRVLSDALSLRRRRGRNARFMDRRDEPHESEESGQQDGSNHHEIGLACMTFSGEST
jgi:hypothetical protein